MTEQDCKECKATAVALKGVSILGFMLFVTIPMIFIMTQNHILITLEKVIFVLCLLTGFICGIRSWHLYFDSQLLKKLGNKNLSLSDVDQIVMRLFGKNIQNKTVEVRIKSCYKLAKGFFVLLALHLVFCIGLFILLLF